MHAYKQKCGTRWRGTGEGGGRRGWLQWPSTHKTRNHTRGDWTLCANCMDMKFRQRHHKSLSAASYHRHEFESIVYGLGCLCQRMPCVRYQDTQSPLIMGHCSQQGGYVCMHGCDICAKYEVKICFIIDKIMISMIFQPYNHTHFFYRKKSHF